MAVALGLSLHADTWVHGNDRQGLGRLIRYGARGPVASSRLTRREDGRYAYETKRGVTLVMTAAQRVRRLLWLIPPRGLHLTNFHGVFASHAAARRTTLLAGAAEPTCTLPTPSQASPRRKRLDWATLLQRTFGCDVWTCACGGRRRVVALVTSPRSAELVLRNLGLLKPLPPLPLAQGPTQLELVAEPH